MKNVFELSQETTSDIGNDRAKDNCDVEKNTEPVLNQAKEMAECLESLPIVIQKIEKVGIDEETNNIVCESTNQCPPVLNSTQSVQCTSEALPDTSVIVKQENPAVDIDNHLISNDMQDIKQEDATLCDIVSDSIDVKPTVLACTESEYPTKDSKRLCSDSSTHKPGSRKLQCPVCCTVIDEKQTPPRTRSVMIQVDTIEENIGGYCLVMKGQSRSTNSTKLRSSFTVSTSITLFPQIMSNIL